MTEREKSGERLAMEFNKLRQGKFKYEDIKTAYIKGCEDTARSMLAHSIADIQNTRKEAALILNDIVKYSPDVYSFEKVQNLRKYDDALARAVNFINEVGK